VHVHVRWLPPRVARPWTPRPPAPAQPQLQPPSPRTHRIRRRRHRRSVQRRCSCEARPSRYSRNRLTLCCGR
jgi:hypothetical protein